MNTATNNHKQTNWQDEYMLLRPETQALLKGIAKDLCDAMAYRKYKSGFGPEAGLELAMALYLKFPRELLAALEGRMASKGLVIHG